MITCLACRCHASEPRIRRVLREAHLKDWALQPIIRGKDECLSYLEGLPSSITTEALKKYVSQNSSWAVVLGIDGENVDWAEVGHGGDKARLDGIVLVERYKDEITKDN